VKVMGGPGVVAVRSGWGGPVIKVVACGLLSVPSLGSSYGAFACTRPGASSGLVYEEGQAWSLQREVQRGRGLDRGGIWRLCS